MAKGWMGLISTGLIVCIGLIGVLRFGRWDAEEAKKASENVSMFLRAQMEERSGRLERYLDPEFFENRGNAALSERMAREIPEFDPEDPFDVLPEGLKVILQEEGWQVVLYDEGIGEKGAGQIVGQMDPAARTIELTVQDSEQTTLVMFHEVGHIVAAKIRSDLIRAGYTSRETLPSIVFHDCPRPKGAGSPSALRHQGNPQGFLLPDGADTGYHEDLYEEYLANYLAESFFWSENARMAGEEFFITYQAAMGDFITHNPVGKA